LGEGKLQKAAGSELGRGREHSQNINRGCTESCTFKPDGKTA